MEASPNMLGIVAFHNDLSFVLAIVSGFTLVILLRMIILFSVANASVDEDTNTAVLKIGIRPFQHHTALEVVWTSIPIVILLLVAGPSLSLLYSSDELIDPRLTIKVIGHQWYWSYEMSDAVSFSDYPANAAKFFDMLTAEDDDNTPANAAKFFDMLTAGNNEMLSTTKDVSQSWADTVASKDVAAFNADMTRFNILVNEDLKGSVFYCLLDYMVNKFSDEQLEDLAAVLVSERISAEEVELACVFDNKLWLAVESYALRNFYLTRVPCHPFNINMLYQCAYPESEADVEACPANATSPVVVTTQQRSECFSAPTVPVQGIRWTTYVDLVTGLESYFNGADSEPTSRVSTLVKDAADRANSFVTNEQILAENLTPSEIITVAAMTVDRFSLNGNYESSVPSLFEDAKYNLSKTSALLEKAEKREECECDRKIREVYELYSKQQNAPVEMPAVISKALELSSAVTTTPAVEVVTTTTPAVEMTSTGKQWVWEDKQWIWEDCPAELTHLDYMFDSYMVPESDLELGQIRLLETTKSLVVPTDTQIRFLVTSADVLHSWAVPSLGIKIDACPGRLNQVGTTVFRRGVFYGQCSEICGINHGFMPIQVEAIGLPSFRQYYAENYVVPGVPSVN